MFSVIHFTQHLAKKPLNNNPERLALFNYLQYVCDGEQALKVEILNQFYRKALLFYYWRKRNIQLQQFISKEMISFAKCYNSFEWDSSEWNPAKPRQIIQIQQQKDLLEITTSFIEKQLSDGDQVQVIPLYLDRVLAIILKKDNRLKVCSFGSLTILNKGHIEPLSPLSELHYSDHYELNPAYKQIIDDGGTRFIYFYIEKNRVKGYECQSPSFKQISTFKNKNIDQTNNLFNRLKQMETLFIHPQSDPHYRKLVQSLNNHYHQILTHQTIDSTITQNIISESRQALRNLYPKDQLLILLIANIEFHARQQHSFISL